MGAMISGNWSFGRADVVSLGISVLSACIIDPTPAGTPAATESAEEEAARSQESTQGDTGGGGTRSDDLRRELTKDLYTGDRPADPSTPGPRRSSTTGAVYDKYDKKVGEGFAEAADDYHYVIGARDWIDALSQLRDRLAGIIKLDALYVFSHASQSGQSIPTGNRLSPHGKLWQELCSHVRDGGTIHLRGCYVGDPYILQQYANTAGRGITVTGYDDLVYYLNAERPGADYYSFGNLRAARAGQPLRILHRSSMLASWLGSPR